MESQEPLGTVLVTRGLITDEQLAVALEEQKVSGEQLGTILVARGFAPPALVAQALATQQGRVMKTEYGFATGFGTAFMNAGMPGEPPLSAHTGRKAVAGAPVVERRNDPAIDRSAVRAELELASSETSRLEGANERLTSLRAELEQRLAQESQRAASLERELTELKAAPAAAPDPGATQDAAAWQAAHAQVEHALTQWQAAYAELDQRLAQATERASSLESAVAARDAALDELRAAASACESARTELEQELATEAQRAAALKDELEAAEQQQLTSVESADAVRAELEQRLAQVTERAEALDAQVVAGEALRASSDGSDEASSGLEQRLQQAAEQLRAAEEVRGELAQRLAAATESAAGHEARALETEELRRSALESEQTVGALERQLDAVRAELEQRVAEIEELRVVVEAGPWAGAKAHLVFFQGAEGYELVERDGPPPSEGSQIELPDRPAQVVSRVGRSPFPGDVLPCAYLSS